MKSVLRKATSGVPSVTLHQIINYCGRKTYELGREYLDTEALYVRYQEARAIKALCAGLSAPSYTLKVCFDSCNIISSSCSCIENHAGPCKHLAALLITWYYQPATFPKRAELPAKLMQAPKEELISLIQKIIDLYPETEKLDNKIARITALG